MQRGRMSKARRLAAGGKSVSRASSLSRLTTLRESSAEVSSPGDDTAAATLSATFPRSAGLDAVHAAAEAASAAAQAHATLAEAKAAAAVAKMALQELSDSRYHAALLSQNLCSEWVASYHMCCVSCTLLLLAHCPQQQLQL